MKSFSPVMNIPIARRTLNNARPLRYSVLTVICGSVMILGFFFAARQHFSSIDYGIKNSRLRKQLDELEAEKRRLLLAKEISMTPGELMKSARKIGFTKTDSAGGASKAEALRTDALNAKAPAVQKTVMSRPAIKVDDNTRAQKIERQVKREGALKDKKS